MKTNQADKFISFAHFVFALCVLTLSIQEAFARPLQATIFDIRPWGYKDDQGRIAGLQSEIIDAISKEIDEPILKRLTPYKRMIHELKTGMTDFSIFFRSEKSELSADPLVKWADLDIIVIGQDGVVIEDYKDLKKYTLLVRLGGFFHPRFDKDNNLDKHPVNNYEEGINILMRQKRSAIIGTAATLSYEFKKQGIDVEKLGNPYFLGTKSDWLHFSRKSKNQNKREKISKAVDKLIKNRTFKRIFSKYLPKSWEH